jgi:hypothetical protein
VLPKNEKAKAKLQPDRRQLSNAKLLYVTKIRFKIMVSFIIQKCVQFK